MVVSSHVRLPDKTILKFIHFPVVPVWNIGPLFVVSVISHIDTR
jgi:hypothetical protein